MHSYLRAIGFANITKESEVEKLLEDVYKKFDHREAVRVCPGYGNQALWRC